MKRVLIICLFLLWTSSLYASAHYISTGGADTNNGTSEMTPWAHLPGMKTCTNNCASYTPVAGDTFTLRGCDDWGNSNFPITWTWSGSAGNVITIGVDKTWYNTGPCPSAWNRPIFDQQGSQTISGSRDQVIIALFTGHQKWDNIENTGFTWSTSYSTGSAGIGVWAAGPGDVSISNWYIHGWIHNMGVTSDSCVFFYGDTNSPYMAGSTFDYNLIDGTDSTNKGDSCAVTYAWPGGTHNVIHDAGNGLLPTLSGEVAFNKIYNILSFDVATHSNGIEILDNQGHGNGTFVVHDNLVYNVTGEDIRVGNANETDYVMNNVIYDGTGNGNMIAFPQTSWSGAPGGVALYILNNTIQSANGKDCFQTQNQSPAWSIITTQNNHCITSSNTLQNNTPSATTLTQNHNLVQTVTVADQNLTPAFDQYTSSQTYANSPVASTNSTVGQGINVSAIWPGGYSTNDTTYACYQTISNTITCPDRTSNARGVTWDIGAYQLLQLTSGGKAIGAALSGGKIQ